MTIGENILVDALHSVSDVVRSKVHRHAPAVSVLTNLPDGQFPVFRQVHLNIVGWNKPAGLK
ncbi:hypothetical protein T10_10333 [Trichinella papuae]|uniref:Uncharacterized protein n=1 Tax=Trichinella papuae TaxID=268474 RepID=A0A0V1MHF4_9BILA|nr:hypothetical protein T10_10333 [Trichinella papuae]